MKNLYKALADFQQEVPAIYKNAKGYSYKFADLGEITDIIKPILKKHGLGYVQPIEGSSIKTIVFHAESGESIESSADIPQGVQLKGMNDFQVLGSAITYLRRYSLSSMLGLITDEDADAAGEQNELKKVYDNGGGRTTYQKWTPSGDKPVNDNQRSTIQNLLRQRGIIAKGDINDYMYENYGGAPENELDAQVVIDDLNNVKED